MTEPKKPMGRPVGTAAPPEDRRKPRAVRLKLRHWEKLRRLGSEWLEGAIESAPEPKE